MISWHIFDKTDSLWEASLVHFAIGVKSCLDSSNQSSPARTRHADSVALDAAVQLAAVLGLQVEGVQLV